MVSFSTFSLAATALALSTSNVESALPNPLVGAFFPNWAQYRPAPYTFTPDNLPGIIDELDILWYGFSYFCPNSTMFQPYWVTELTLCDPATQAYEVITIEPMDETFFQEINSYKSSINPDLIFMLSVGGWNFPSNYFSGMVSTNATRQVFIQSCLEYLTQYNLDGIDLDWEYPGSKPRLDLVRISCTEIHDVYDYGGTYKDPEIDKKNFVLLVSEMRDAFTELGKKNNKDYYITICGQANLTNVERGFDVKHLSKYIDIWNIMTYDYSVPNTNLTISEYTAPNEPLYPPKSVPTISQLSVTQTVNGYISMGAPANKINLGIAYYGHTWYIPGLTSEAEWCKYGLQGTKQGECCGFNAQTYGAKYGEYCVQCGNYMYSEILAAGFDTCFDNETMTTIGYMTTASSDDWTAAGVWINYQSPTSITAYIKFAQSLDLLGIFAFDVSQDSLDISDATFTFELTKLIVEQMKSKN